VDETETTTVTQSPIVTMTDTYAFTDSGKNKIAFQMTRSVPEGYTVIKYGALYSTDELNESQMVVANENVKRTVKDVTPLNNGIYTLNLVVTNKESNTYYVRGYVTYTDSNGNEYTVYTAITNASYDSLTQ
jgi:mRNA-degrading endonuclease HigB of HigAB toxin-antitoxin module